VEIKPVLEASVRAVRVQLADQQKYWDGRLSRSEKWHLAPTHLLSQGAVNDENYQRWTSAFATAVEEFMREYLDRVRSETTEAECLEAIYVGFGEGDDAGWFRHAIKQGFRILVGDFSPQALKNAKRFAERLAGKMEFDSIPIDFAEEDMITVLEKKRQELKRLGGAGKGRFLFLSRVLENDPDLDETLPEIGKLLSLGMELVLAHPFGEDNPNFVSSPRTGAWQAVAHSRKAILTGLAQGAKRNTEIKRKITFRFFDRTYTICSIG